MAAKSLISSYGDHVPRDKHQRLVSTPYGEGLIVRTSSRVAEGQSIVIYEMELTNWERSEGSHAKPATLFSPIKYPSVPVVVGCDALCSFGRGRVVEIREDSMVVIRLSSWRLAQRSQVTCFLQPEKVEVVRHKVIYEMTVAEKIDYALILKQDASKQFALKEYEAALRTYSKAIDTVRYVQHKSDSTNELRADLLVLMITCSNNAATCAMQIQSFEKASTFADMALTLIDALEGKKGLKIHTLLNKEGFDDSKLFGDWKVKSLLVLAKANFKKQNTQEALYFLKTAHSVVSKISSDGEPGKTMQAYTKDISKLYSVCKHKRQTEKEKEKKRAQAMFTSASGVSSGNEKDTSPEKQTDRPVVVKARNSVSPTSVADGEEDYTGLSLDKPSQSAKKRVTFSADVKPSQEEAEEEFYLWLGLVGVGVAAFGAVVGGMMLLSRPRSG
jgi:tetratricopeptide (TPR) repeat protein